VTWSRRMRALLEARVWLVDAPCLLCLCGCWQHALRRRTKQAAMVAQGHWQPFLCYRQSHSCRESACLRRGQVPQRCRAPPCWERCCSGTVQHRHQHQHTHTHECCPSPYYVEQKGAMLCVAAVLRWSECHIRLARQGISFC
jgi:hypothetical protein